MFRQLWGDYAGWAQSVMFSSDLKIHQDTKASVTATESAKASQKEESLTAAPKLEKQLPKALKKTSEASRTEGLKRKQAQRPNAESVKRTKNI